MHNRRVWLRVNFGRVVFETEAAGEIEVPLIMQYRVGTRICFEVLRKGGGLV